MYLVLFVLFFNSFACQEGLVNYKKYDDVCILDSGFDEYIKVSIKDDILKLRHRGKYMIEGYLASNLEDRAIYQGKSIDAKGYSLNYVKEIQKRYPLIEQLNGKRVFVYGILNLEKHGHLNSYFGEIDSVVCIKMIR
jgi:hypothetical protein